MRARWDEVAALVDALHRQRQVGAVDSQHHLAADADCPVLRLPFADQDAGGCEVAHRALHEHQVHQTLRRRWVDDRPARGLALRVGDAEREAETAGNTDLGHFVELIDELLAEADRPAVGGVDHVVADERAAHRVADLLLDGGGEH